MSERDKYPSEAAERFQIRLPAGLRDRIKRSAQRNGRSMNAEIIQVLEERFPEIVLMSISIGEVMEIAEVYRDITGKTSEQTPLSSDFISYLWSICVDDDANEPPEVRDAVRAKATELGLLQSVGPE